MSSDEIEDVSDHFSNSHHRSHRQIGDSSGGSDRFISTRNPHNHHHHHRRHSGTSATLTAMVAAARVDAERKVFAVRRVTAPSSSTAVVERTPSARWAHAASQGDADSDFGVPTAQLPLQRPSLPPPPPLSSAAVVVIHDDDNDDVVRQSDSSGWISAPRSGTRVNNVTVLSSPSSSSSSSSPVNDKTPAAKRRAISTPYTQSVVRHRSGASSMYVPVSPFATPPTARDADGRGGIPFDAIGSPSPDNFHKSRAIADVVVDDDDDDDRNDDVVDNRINSDDGDSKRSSIVVAGDDIEDVSDAVLELKARSHPRASQLFGSRAKLPVLFAADAGDVGLQPTPMRRARRSHAERVASASACTDARVLFWSHSSATAVERAARGETAALYVESLGTHRRVATYTRYVDVCNATVAEIAVADDELLCTLVSSRGGGVGVRCQLAVSLAVDASIREQLYSLQKQARSATWRRLECDEAQLINVDADADSAENKPYILYSVSWCDASAVSVV